MPRRTPPPRDPQVDLAGDLSVALVNTAGARPDNRQQGIETYAGFVTWSQAVGTVSATGAERLLRQAAERPRSAAAAFTLVDNSRTALADSFLAAQRQEPADESCLAAFNHALAESSLTLPHLIIAASGAAWVWGGEDALEAPLAPVLLSASRLMTAAEGQAHVRQCAAPGCRLFFVDRSSTGHRKWCSMELCGNRAKNRNHYRRKGKAERKQRRKGAVPKPRSGR